VGGSLIEKELLQDGMDSTKMFAASFDHTLLRPTATENEIVQLCEEAVEHSFFSVCVNPCWLDVCKATLATSSVKLCTVVGFPLGANDSFTKLKETESALKHGANEIDCVLNIGFLKSGRAQLVANELTQLTSICRGHALVKVIVESGVLSHEELLQAISLVNESSAEFIKTSTGFAHIGATEVAVKTMRQFGRPNLKIKASGGIKTAEDFRKYVDLGASRIGASQSVSILKELEGTT
jgi:deoxyribose-phosphate aldolase